MAWKWICISLESQMGCPDGSGTKPKLYKPVSQIACVSVSIFWYLTYTHSHVPGLQGEALFLEISSFFCCLPIVDQYEFIIICIIQTCTGEIIYKTNFTYESMCTNMYMLIPVWSQTLFGNMESPNGNFLGFRKGITI